MRYLKIAAAISALALGLANCASVNLSDASTLTSTEHLGPSKGKLSKSRTYVDGPGLASVKTVKIVPTTFTYKAATRVTKVSDQRLVANALDRALCVNLSDKYQMVTEDQPADLVVRAVITDVVPTNRTMAGVSTVVSLGSGAVMPSDVPISIPRLPFGLGGLAVEAEAMDSTRTQRAAIVWARGANSIQNDPRVSQVGDAYGLASKFSDDFSKLLISGKEPKGLSISIPSGQKIRSSLGGRPKYVACEAYGRSPGVPGLIAGRVGAPPEWTDKRSRASTEAPVARSEDAGRVSAPAIQ